MLREKGLKVDEARFDELMSEQKARAKLLGKAVATRVRRVTLKSYLRNLARINL